MKIEIDLGHEIPSHISERDVLLHLLAGQKHIIHQLNQIKETIMIAQSVLDASLKAASDAVAAAIANIPAGTTASTPDTAVQAYVTGIDTLVAQLNAAEAAVTPPAPKP